MFISSPFPDGKTVFYALQDGQLFMTDGKDTTKLADYESIDKVSYGVPLAMTGKVGNWYQIDYNGRTAYIIEDYVVVTVLPE